MTSEIYRREETALAWGSVATTETGATCTGDTEIDCRNAKKIIMQIDQKATTHNGANTDINILTRSKDGATYDTLAFDSTTHVASAAVESWIIDNIGFAYMKLTVDNNDTTNKCAPKVIVQIVG